MGFLAPLALLGLTLTAVPVVFHLLRRRDIKQQVLPTVRLLMRAEAQQKRHFRIDDLWLLATRIALFAMASLALAAPFGIAKVAFGDGETVALALIVDDSMSTSHRGDHDTVLDRELIRARRVIESLPLGSEVAVILAGSPARVLLARSDRMAEAIRRLGNVTPGSARGTDIGRAVGLSLRELSSARHSSRRILLLADDTADFSELPPNLHAELSIERFALEGPRSNYAIARANAVPDPLADGQLSLSVEVRAFGEVRESIEIVAQRLDGQELGRTSISLHEGSGRGSLRVAAPRTTDTRVAVAIAGEPDRLREDDARVLSIRGISAPGVIIVDGDPRPLARRGSGRPEAAGYLQRALELASQEDSSLSPRVIDPGALGSVGAEESDVLILADVDLSSAPLRRRIEAHLQSGGGLLFTGGERVRAADWSALSFPLPARSVSRVDSALVGMIGGDGDVLPQGATGLSEVQVRSRLFLESAPDALVPLRFSDHSPALVVDLSRRIAVLATDVGDAWSDLPLRPGFLPLMVTLVRALRRPFALPETPFAPGQVPALRVPEDVSNVFVEMPGGEEAEGIITRERTLDVRDYDRPGAYRIVFERDGARVHGARSTMVIAPPLNESDLAERPAPDGHTSPGTPNRQTDIPFPLSPYAFAMVGILAVLEAHLRSTRIRTSSSRTAA